MKTREIKYQLKKQLFAYPVNKCLSVFVLLIFILTFDKRSYSKYDAVEFLWQGLELRIKANSLSTELLLYQLS